MNRWSEMFFHWRKPDHASSAGVSAHPGGTRHDQSVLVLNTATVVESVNGPSELQRRRRHDFKTRWVAAVNDEVIFVMADENWMDQITFGNGNKTHSAFSFNFPYVCHPPYFQTRFENILNLKKKITIKDYSTLATLKRKGQFHAAPGGPRYRFADVE